MQAHPDDTEFVCGGTIALLAQEGKDIHYLTVREEIREEEEQRAAARLLGVQTLTFLDGYSDGEVEASIALRWEIVFVVRQ